MLSPDPSRRPSCRACECARRPVGPGCWLTVEVFQVQLQPGERVIDLVCCKRATSEIDQHELTEVVHRRSFVCAAEVAVSRNGVSLSLLVHRPSQQIRQFAWVGIGHGGTSCIGYVAVRPQACPYLSILSFAWAIIVIITRATLFTGFSSD